MGAKRARDEHEGFEEVTRGVYFQEMSVVEPIKNMWCEVEGFLEGCVILGKSLVPTEGLATWGESGLGRDHSGIDITPS